jgi:hypothetical protein
MVEENTMKVYELKNWSIVDRDFSRAPELRRDHLAGQIYGRAPVGADHFEDGHHVYTSHVEVLYANEEGKGYAITQTGSRYRLSEPNPDWLKWLKEHNLTIMSFNKAC